MTEKIHNSSPASLPASADITFRFPLERAVLREVIEQIERAGYAEHYASYNPIFPDPLQWQAHLKDAPDHLAPILRLFLLREAVSADSVRHVLHGAVDEMVRMGLLIGQDNEHIQTPNLVLLPIHGLWMFCEEPSARSTLYFGGDSIALASRLRPKPGSRALDLCAGTGFQSLICSSFGCSVTAVEINPVAAEVVRLNALLNCREDAISVRVGDLYSASDEAPYAVIIANPPFLPIPKGVAYPFAANGGSDGLCITWRILDGLPKALARSGHAHIMGTCYCDSASPRIVDRLSAWCAAQRMDVLMTITGRKPLAGSAEAFGQMAKSAGDCPAVSDRAVAAEFAADWSAHSATHLAAFFLYIRHGTGELCVQNMYRGGAGGFWYAH